MSKKVFSIALASVCIVTASLTCAGGAVADPAGCTNPSDPQCTAEGPGCVDPNTSLPCSSSLPDVNAAIRRELQQLLPGLGGR